MPSVRHQLALSFVRQSAPYTALYLRSAAMTAVSQAEGVVTATATVENHEGRAVDYRYETTLSVAGFADVLSAGHARVEPEHSADINLKLPSPPSSPQAHVVVRLLGRPESLSFRVMPEAAG